MAAVVLELPDSLRSELKEPLGPIYTDADELLAAATHPLVTVGDVVTYHVLEAGSTPDVALTDEHTERSAVDPKIAETIAAADGFDRVERVSNPAATLTEPLLSALVAALDRAGTTLIEVDGEEDLAALPAVLAAPEGSSIVYGQPGEGMVLGTVDTETRDRVWELLERMDGDLDQFRSLVD